MQSKLLQGAIPYLRKVPRQSVLKARFLLQLLSWKLRPNAMHGSAQEHP